MARCGNHGIVIPRDRALLHALYWERQMTMPQMAAHFGVTHASIRKAMDELGIERRPRGRNTARVCQCGQPIMLIPHKLTKHGTGRRCKDCYKRHRTELQRQYVKLERVQRYKKQYEERYYREGATNPKGELGWIRKSRALLRLARKLTWDFRAALLYRNAASALERTSLT